ncbi:MAG: hypothetical protein ACYC3L_01305 [Gemmatimonadaceae bacterium]
MSEYATYRGESVKIGTCEDMYYLRHDQRHLVTPERNSLDPVQERHALRFRFPFPDEDATPPGHFESHERSVAAPHGWRPQDTSFDHYNVQFASTSPRGYLLSIPCPESGALPAGLTVHKNGWGGDYQLVQQRELPDGRLVPVLQCGGCRGKFRLEDRHDVESLAVAFRAEGDRLVRISRDKSPHEGAFHHAIADRLLAGFNRTTGATP